jgi:hypothetical protein
MVCVLNGGSVDGKSSGGLRHTGGGCCTALFFVHRLDMGLAVM